MSSSNTCQVYNLLAHCYCSHHTVAADLSQLSECSSSPDHKKNCCIEQHNKAAMLIRTGPLYTDSFAAAEQDAGSTTGCMKLTNVDRELCVQLVLHVIPLAIHHLHFAGACSGLVSPRKFYFVVRACGELPAHCRC